MSDAIPSWCTFTADDLVFFGSMGGYRVVVTSDGEPSLDDLPPEGDESPSNPYEDELPADPEVRALVRALVAAHIEQGDDAFNDLYLANRSMLVGASRTCPAVGRVVIVGLELGVNHGNAFCANNLGSLYYLGDIVEQDYARAAALYELAMEWGCHQSIINLGYIHEYGRCAPPDYQKAYQYYALAAALAPTCEALYKFGDMYSRGRAVPRDLRLARALWQRSYDTAADGGDPEDIAQPAIRLAKLYLRENAEEAGLAPDALKALELYQKAEIGLRISVGKGLDYYRGRLQEAIEGQEAARAQLAEGNDEAEKG